MLALGLFSTLWSAAILKDWFDIKLIMKIEKDIK